MYKMLATLAVALFPAVAHADLCDADAVNPPEIEEMEVFSEYDGTKKHIFVGYLDLTVSCDEDECGFVKLGAEGEIVARARYAGGREILVAQPYAIRSHVSRQDWRDGFYDKTVNMRIPMQVCDGAEQCIVIIANSPPHASCS